MGHRSPMGGDASGPKPIRILPEALSKSLQQTVPTAKGQCWAYCVVLGTSVQSRQLALKLKAGMCE